MTYNQETSPSSETPLQPTDLQILQYSTRVKSGAILLDIAIPDWYNEINLDKLDMARSTKCVLGQLSINRDKTFYALGSELGIERLKTLCLFGFWDHYGEEYELLTATWAYEIRTRRARFEQNQMRGYTIWS